MMPETVFTLFVVSVVIGLFFGAMMLFGASIYDLMSHLQVMKDRKIPYSKLNRYRPAVTMVLPCFNEADVIERCLDNLVKVRYKKLEIIVADDKSKDNSRELVRQYIKSHPDKNIKLVCKRNNGGRGAALNLGFKHAQGEIVIAYDPDCLIEKNAIHKLVRHFASSEVSAVAANVRIIPNNTVLGLIQQIEYLVSFRTKKFNTVTNSEFIIGGAGASYRKSAFLACGGFNEKMKTEDIELSMRMTRILGKTGGLKYASDYVVYTEPVPTYRGLFRQRYRWKFGSLQALFANRKLIFSLDRKQNPFTTWMRLPFALWSEAMLFLEPLYFLFFVYIAIARQNGTLFIYACIAYSVITLLAIWSDEHLKFTQKLRLTYITPMTYLTSFVMTIVQVAAAYRCVKNILGITGVKHISGAYITTQRNKTTMGLPA